MGSLPCRRRKRRGRHAVAVVPHSARPFAICGACLPGRKPLSWVGCGRRKGVTGDRVVSTGHALIWQPSARWCGRVGRIRASRLRFVVVTGSLGPVIASSRLRAHGEPRAISLSQSRKPAALSNSAAGHRSDPAHEEQDRDRVHDSKPVRFTELLGGPLERWGSRGHPRHHSTAPVSARVCVSCRALLPEPRYGRCRRRSLGLWMSVRRRFQQKSPRCTTRAKSWRNPREE